MFQLNFYPHMDLHHTAFRAFCLADKSPPIPIDGYRLLDFFITFPFELGIIRIRGGKLQKLANRFERYRPYRWTSDPLQTFLQMLEFQTVAVRALARKGVVDSAALAKSTFRGTGETSNAANAAIYEALERYLADRGEIIEALLEIIKDHGVTGKDGLKARSGLMPFKYDPDQNVVLD